MTLHVLFTESGIPGWIGSEPREGSEPLEGLTVEFLAGHRRLFSGKWVPRDPPSPPSAEDIAIAEAEEARVQAEAVIEANQRKEEEIARRCGPDALLRSMGKITIAELTARVAVIRAAVEAGS